MDDTRFWLLLDDCFRDYDADDGLALLEAKLSGMPRSKVVRFQHFLNDQMIRAYRWDLIGAACFFGRGKPGDGFEDFRAWLISQGSETFERVLANPECLVEFEYKVSPAEEWHLERLHVLPGELAGEEDDDDWPYLCDPKTPVGSRIELTKDALSQRFPKLWAKFGDQFMSRLA